jgi:integrase
VIEPGELVLIRAVKGYSHKEGVRLDRRREVSRVGHKKAEAVTLSTKQAAALKAQPKDLPQGRRDALLMCLLLDHGLRCGEVARLTVENLDIDAGKLRFYRPKVDLVQVHRLSADTLAAARLYQQDAPDRGFLLRGSRKNGSLANSGMSEQSITARVLHLGREIGIEGLSAHDCRHYWATVAAANGTPLDRLQQAGGWTSPAMPLRYIEAAEVANQGVRLE